MSFFGWSTTTTLILAHGAVFLLLLLVGSRWYLERWQRRLAEANVRQSQAKLENILDSAMDAIISINDRQEIILFNQAAEKLFGYSAKEMMGQPLDRLIPLRFRAVHGEYVRQFGASGVSQRTMASLGIVKGLRQSGEEFPIEVSISQTELAGKKIYSAIVRDITARQQVEEALRRSEALLAKAQELAHIGSFEIHLQSGMDHWSDELFVILGREKSEGPLPPEEMIRLYVHEEDLPRVQQVVSDSLRKGQPWELAFRIKRADGTLRHVLSRGQPLAEDSGQFHKLIGFIMDETEKSKLEAQLLRAQRLESIGILAGGIAHDLNNMLTPIMMSVTLLRQERAELDRKAILNTLQMSAERGAAMVKKLLTFTGGIERLHVPLRVQDLMAEVGSILQHTLPKNINLDLRVEPDLWTVKGDMTQLSQVLMNLAINARDAMPEGGQLNLHAENRDIDAPFLRTHHEGKPGRYVMISITDTGTGIPPDAIEKIFDPFFTTKETGKGTGLGLSAVRGIVRSHGGLINVYSEVGQGTQFVIYLPAEDALAETPETPKAAGPARSQTGQLILVVDDESNIIEAARLTLEGHGYRVVTAQDGRDGVRQLQQHQGQIGAVLLDMMMPHMDGPAAIDEMRALDPQLKIITMSGLRTPTRTKDLALDKVQAFLQKPFTGEQLLKVIDDVLQNAQDHAWGASASMAAG